MEHGLISNIIPLIENLLKHYGAFTVGVSVFLLGENAALAVFALAAQGMINPLTAFIWAFVGSLLSDVFWFFIAEYCLRDYYERRILKAKQVESNRFFMRMVDKHFFWMLIFIKFIVGVRLILTIYIVLKNRIPFSRKIFLDAIGTVFFMAFLFMVGSYIGNGNSDSLTIEQTVERIISFIVLFFVVSHFATKLIEKIINKGHGRENTLKKI